MALLQRDIENLLNSYPLSFARPAQEGTLLTYGFSHLKRFDLSSLTAQQLFCQRVKVCIETHEPRVRQVNVTVDTDHDPLTTDLVFHFKVSAQVWVNEGPEPLIWYSHIDPLKGHIRMDTEKKTADGR